MWRRHLRVSTSRLPRTAEVFPCVPYLVNMLYKEWDASQKVCQKTLQPVKSRAHCSCRWLALQEGLAVSSATVPRWFRRIVLQAYALKGRAPPFRVNGAFDQDDRGLLGFPASCLCVTAVLGCILVVNPRCFKVLRGGCVCIF